MMSTRPAASSPRRRLAAALAAAALLLVAAPAVEAQQPGDDLLRVLKPWIKRQLLGGGSPAEAESATTAESEEAAGGEPAETAAETEGEPALDAPEAGEATAGAAPADEDAQAPQDEVADAPADGLGAETVPAEERVFLGAEPPPEPEEAAAAPAQSEEIPAAPAEPVTPPLRFAVLAGRDAAATIAAVAPIADEIGETLGRPAEFLAMPSYAAMVDAQVGRRIDGGFFSASAFALAQSRCQCLEPIVAPRASDGTLAYHAVIVARTDSGIASAFDLEGATVAVGAADSVGARRMQLAGLMASGIDPATTFGGVLEVASAIDAVRLVRDGIADAAFAWSSLSGNAARGYSRGTLTQMVASGEIAMRDLAIVWRSDPIAHGPFAALDTLGEEAKDRIGALFVALEATRPDAYDALNPFYAGGYAPVDADDYDGLETLVAQDVDALRLPKAVAEVAVPESAPPDAEAAQPPSAN